MRAVNESYINSLIASHRPYNAMQLACGRTSNCVAQFVDCIVAIGLAHFEHGS